MFIRICKFVLLLLPVVGRLIEENRFLMKALYFLLICFDSETKLVLVLSGFVAKCWSADFWRFCVEIDEMIVLDRECVLICAIWILVSGKVLVGSWLKEGSWGIG